jgi:VanZ family protein
MRYILFFLYFTYMCLILAACFTPNFMEIGFQTDKMLHISAVCIALLWPCLTFRRWRNIMIFSALILAGGISVEILQGLTPDRQSEWGDIAANIIGICLGLIIGYLIRSGYHAENRKAEAEIS